MDGHATILGLQRRQETRIGRQLSEPPALQGWLAAGDGKPKGPRVSAPGMVAGIESGHRSFIFMQGVFEGIGMISMMLWPVTRSNHPKSGGGGFSSFLLPSPQPEGSTHEITILDDTAFAAPGCAGIQHARQAGD